MPSGLSLPVRAMPRPSAHMTFSLSSGINVAPSRSNTTRRSEFDPRSTTAMRPTPGDESGGPGRLRSGTGGRDLTARRRPGPPVWRPPQRLAAPGQARIGHEIGVGRKPLLVGRDPLVRAVRREAPALQRVAQVGHHDLVEDLPVHGRVLDRHQRLDAAVEIARHPVGRADEHLGLVRGQPVAVAEADDAAVLEEAADDALDPDVLRHARHAGPQAADAAHDQVDLTRRPATPRRAGR